MEDKEFKKFLDGYFKKLDFHLNVAPKLLELLEDDLDWDQETEPSGSETSEQD